MTSRALSSLLLLALAASGCSNLQPISAEICGNKIVEPEAGEDCDGGENCGAATAGVSACRITCDPDPNNVIPCPGGFGCGTDKICRQHSGDFELVFEADAITVFADTGYIDDDGRLDVLRVSENGSTAQFYEDDFSLASSVLIPGDSDDVPPILGELTFDDAGDPDGLEDVAVTVEVGVGFGSGLSIYRSGSNRTFAPTSYATVQLEGKKVLGTSLSAVDPFNQDQVMAFVLDGVSNATLVGVDNDREVWPFSFSAPVNPDRITGVVAANVIKSSPCEELIWTVGGAVTPQLRNKLFIYEPCGIGDDGTAYWEDSDDNLTVIDLPAPALDWRPLVGEPLRQAPGFRNLLFIADANADGRDDIVVVLDHDRPIHYVENLDDEVWATGTNPVVAVPNVVSSISDLPDVPPPDMVHLGLCEFEPGSVTNGEVNPYFGVGLPLVIDDLNGDGALDYITDDTLWMSEPRADGAGHFYRLDDGCMSWGSAIVADFDRNGTRDIAATVLADNGVEIALGSGDGVFTWNQITTERQVSFISAGDYDGDSVTDLGFVELDLGALAKNEVDRATDAVWVAFGATEGGFDTPISLGALRGARGIVSGRLDGGDATDDMLIPALNLQGDLAIALFAGSGSRQIVSPFLFKEDGELTEILAMTAGRFFAPGEDNTRLAVVTTTEEGFEDEGAPAIDRLWPLVLTGEAELGTSYNKTVALNGRCAYGCVATAIDLDGDERDELIVLGEGGVAFTAGADPDTFWGDPVELELGDLCTFDAEITKPQVADVNFDGIEDLLIVGWDCATGGLGALVLFNDGSGTLRASNAVSIVIPDEISSEIAAIGLLNIDKDDSLELVVSAIEYLGPFDARGETRVFELPDEPEVLSFDEGEPLSVLNATLYDVGETFLPGDFNGDGVQDLIVTSYGSYSILRGVPVR